jgi:hypothetical protein
MYNMPLPWHFFFLFLHSFENVKTIQGYLDLQSALRKDTHKNCFSALQDCIGTEGFKWCSSSTWHSQRNRGKRSWSFQTTQKSEYISSWNKPEFSLGIVQSGSVIWQNAWKIRYGKNVLRLSLTLASWKLHKLSIHNYVTNCKKLKKIELFIPMHLRYFSASDSWLRFFLSVLNKFHCIYFSEVLNMNTLFSHKPFLSCTDHCNWDTRQNWVRVSCLSTDKVMQPSAHLPWLRELVFQYAWRYILYYSSIV